MKTRSAKNKGVRLQNIIRDKLLEAFPTLEKDDCTCAIMGTGGMDIKLSPAAKKLIPYAFESKNQEKIAIWSCLEQAEKNSSSNLEPVLVFKRNRSKIYAVIELDEFIKLIKK